MLIDLRQLAGDETFEADVCVVGAGAAGITIARELGAAGHSVLLVESGGFVRFQETRPPSDAAVARLNERIARAVRKILLADARLDELQEGVKRRLCVGVVVA